MNQNCFFFMYKTKYETEKIINKNKHVDQTTEK